MNKFQKLFRYSGEMNKLSANHIPFFGLLFMSIDRAVPKIYEN